MDSDIKQKIFNAFVDGITKAIDENPGIEKSLDWFTGSPENRS